MMAPGSVVYLNTFRSRQMIKVSLVLGTGKCVNELIGLLDLDPVPFFRRAAP
jgi:hypothetical protein